MDIQYRAFSGPHDWGWVQLHLPLLRVEDTSGIMAVDMERNSTIGACILDNWTEGSVQASIILDSKYMIEFCDHPKTVREEFLREIFRHVFDTCGRQLMIALINSDNTKSLRLTDDIGFQEACVLPQAMKEGVSIVIKTVTPTTCRYYTQPKIQEQANG